MSGHSKQLPRRLTGLVLPGGWRVLAPLALRAAAPGGISWQGYLVESADGVRAFLKALDYAAAAPGQPLTPGALRVMTSAYRFERDLLLQCSERGLSRVVTALGSGDVRFADGPPPNLVEYLIFELADGDLARMADLGERFDLAWALRALAHLATGLRQLHALGIAHQDLKPENVLLFGGGLKLGDLGRATRRGGGPLDDLEIAGDVGYAPPELLYGRPDPDWDHRRLGCDAYLLGSMAVYFVTGSPMTALWTAELELRHRWQIWQGPFDEVMPHLRPAFERAVIDFAAKLPAPFAEPLETIVRQLCEPDPRRRGHPRDRLAPFGSPFDLARYAAELDLLAERAEADLRAR